MDIKDRTSENYQVNTKDLVCKEEYACECHKLYCVTILYVNWNDKTPLFVVKQLYTRPK